MKLYALKTLSLLIGLGVALPAAASEYPLFNIMDDRSAKKLEARKISTTSDLLKHAATPVLRRSLSKATGIARAKITQWARLCDLMRIKGIGLKMARLLTVVKVKDVKTLRREKPLALSKKVSAANKKDEVTKTPPTAEQLYNWITQAKKLRVVLR